LSLCYSKTWGMKKSERNSFIAFCALSEAKGMEIIVKEKESQRFPLLLMEMDRFIQGHIADRVLTYYERGLVKNIRLEEPWIRATVSGNHGNYKVRVHLTDFSKSRCDCPYDDYCKHMAAVVYYITREDSGQSGASASAGGFPARAADGAGAEDTAGTAGRETNPHPAKNLTQQLKIMKKEDLLDLITRLTEIDPSLRETIRLILVERQRTENLRSDRIRRMGLRSALAFYQKEFPAVLKECEFLFTEIEDEAGRYGYEDRYYNDTEGTEWDFSKGLERLDRYGRELVQLVTAENYISGTVGLLVAVTGLEGWSDKYDDGYGDNELTDACLEFESYLREAIERVHDYQLHDPAAQAFLRELITWIVSQNEQLDDLLSWTSVLRHCVREPQYLRHLKEQLMKIDRDFLRSACLQDEEDRGSLASWWVELCLSLDQEEEAKQAAAMVEGSPRSVMFSFVKYYEKLERWPEALTAMQNALFTSPRVLPHDYERIVRLCECSGDRQGIKDWCEKWFLSYPDLDLFKRNTDLVEQDADKEAKIQKWLEALRQKNQFGLLIDIHLYLGDLDKAWSVFIKEKDRFYMSEPPLFKLFEKIKGHEPGRLIPLYQELALKNISQRGRPAYARAAGWLKELKVVCALSGKDREWAAFHGKIMTEYRRFRALMEEVRSAGIGQP